MTEYAPLYLTLPVIFVALVIAYIVRQVVGRNISVTLRGLGVEVSLVSTTSKEESDG